MKKIWFTLLALAGGALIIWLALDFVEKRDQTETEPNEDGAVITTEQAEQNNNVETTERVDEVGLQAGMIPPDFELETLEGDTIKLSELKGQKVIVNFWATWCPPCRAEIPDFIEVYEKEDVEILAVNMEETKNNLEMVEEFVEEFEMPFPVLKDEDGDLMDEYRVVAFPTSYMIDSEGHIQFVAMGAMNYDQIKERLENMD